MKAVSGFSNENSSSTRRDILQFPSYRLLTPSQCIIEADVSCSEFSVDKVTLFSLRPPELFFVKKLKQYFSWFVRDNVPRNSKKVNVYAHFLHENVLSSHWLDATGFLLKLRPCAVSLFRAFVSDQILLTPNDRNLSDAVFILENLHLPSVRKNYVSMDATLSNCVAEVVFHNVLPIYPVKFLLSVLLALGEFDTELDLYCVPTLKDAYIKAKLLPMCESGVDSAKELLNKYVKVLLFTTPGGTASFDRLIVAADEAFRQLHNCEFLVDKLPASLMTTLTEETENSVVEFLRVKKQSIVRALAANTIPNLPAQNELAAATIQNPVEFSITLQRAQNQSLASHAEQSSVIRKLKEAIDKCLVLNNKNFLKHELIVGPPGSGKTYIGTLAVAYALSKGLFAFVTSLAGKRACQFGGEHVHRLFALPVNDDLTPFQQAEFALKNLNYRTERKALLMAMQVLFVEEIGLISAQQWAAMDLILQQLKFSTIPFGGVLIIATGDPCQLPSVSGTNLFMSPLLMTTFNLHLLQYFVRMRDTDGQNVLQCLWEKPITSEAIQLIVTTLSEKCTFLENWDDLVDATVMRVFGRRDAARKAIDDYFERVQNSGQPFLTFTANDEVSRSKSSIWTNATRKMSDFLDKECREPKTLIVHKHAVLKITENMSDQNVSQGHLCVVVDIPQQDASSFSVKLIPPDFYSSSGLFYPAMYDTWRTVIIYRKVGFTHSFRGDTVRRTQFTVANYVASTVHKLMGDTFDYLATAISSSHGQYSIWLPSQLFVIISRVKLLRNLVFVGSKAATLLTIEQLLRKPNLPEQHVYNVLKTLTSKKRTSVLQLTSLCYVPFHVDIPHSEHGFVYLLVSLGSPNLNTFYVGQTNRKLLSRLYDHNTGQGSLFTSPTHRRPWAIAAFMHNFPSELQRLRTENFVQRKLNQYKPKSLRDAFAVCRDVITTTSNKDIILSICGKVSSS